MRLYKVIQKFVRHNKDGNIEDFEINCNFQWTPDKDKLQKDINTILKDVKYREKQISNMKYQIPPYIIIEKEAEGFIVEGKINIEYDYEDVIFSIGEIENVIRKLYEELNGVKVRLTVEVIE